MSWRTTTSLISVAWELRSENVGSVRENKGEQDLALELFERSLQIREKLCELEDDNLAHQRELGIALNNVGRVRENKGEQDLALGLFERPADMR